MNRYVMKLEREKLIKEYHLFIRLGMLVDISHVSKKTMLDVLETTKSPVIFSHSSVYSLCNSVRNVQDDVLLKLVGFVALFWK